MTVEKSSFENDELIISVEGRVDATNANEFSGAVTTIRKDNPGGTVILDLDGLAYISSAGLRVIVALLKSEKEHEPRIINLDPILLPVFKNTGMTSVMNVGVKE